MTEPQTTPTPSTGPDAEAASASPMPLGATPPVDVEALLSLLAEATGLAPLPWNAGEPWPEGWIMSGDATLGRPVHVLDVRGWGYLTGRGDALKMSHDDAFEVQKKWGALVAAAVNAVGPLCEEIKRLRASSEIPEQPMALQGGTVAGHKIISGLEDALQHARASSVSPAVDNGAREILKFVQWNGRLQNGARTCPWCANWREDGHTPTCRLAAALTTEQS